MSLKKLGGIKKEINISSNTDMISLIEKKIDFYKDIIQKTIIHVQKNKILDILGINDVNNCIEKSSELSNKIFEIEKIKNVNTDNVINNLQLINNELSGLLKNYGTDSLEDLLLICFGSNNKLIANEKEIDKFLLLKKYFHPTSYKVVNKKEETKNKNTSTNKDESCKNLSCSEIVSNYKQFHMKVYGIKVYIHNENLNKSLIVFGIVDDVIIDFLNSKFINLKLKEIKEKIPQDEYFKNNGFEKFVDSFMLKTFLIYDDCVEIYNNYVGYLNQLKVLKQKPIAHIVKEFISDDLFIKRNTLINLLINSSNYENQYLAYLLYDLLSNETTSSIDTQEQTILFDSFPLKIKQLFKQAMKNTVQYTNELSNYDINKIPLEQQICLLKVSDIVKEKAMTKLKEIKAKSEDTGSKARQYLDGLLKIPFNIYKREPILNKMQIIKTQFKDIYIKYNIGNKFPEIPCKETYTSVEVFKYIKNIEGNNSKSDLNSQIDKIHNYLVNGDKKKLSDNIVIINNLLKEQNNIKEKIKYHTLNKSQLKAEIEKFIELCKKPENTELLQKTIENFIILCNLKSTTNNLSIKHDISDILKNTQEIKDYIENVKITLDKSVYGHDKAKKQIEGIISQWINGKQDGYCFGFEGPPGLGKTSLAKFGLADCLKDENGNSRPFAMIQMGGDSNGSTLHGHNYTYVGSTWGSIVQILIDKKCMNPIIFIDEVDKISRTEHGREIVGILTHLLDPAQNDCFQDKYFSGIDLDLSKALFILSYNDVTAIDRILLDRIHRIKFSSLSLEDKLIICKAHLLPEIFKKMGLEEMITLNDDVLKFIIEEYTSESGVRKLKEVLFEIICEINLYILKNSDTDFNIPIDVTIIDIKNKYLKDKREVKIYKIHDESKVGVINALWANQLGQGGVLPLQASFIPCNKFLDLTLTGSMGEVMKESISVSLTNAWNLTNTERQKYLTEKYNDKENNQVYGIHIHCPDISTKKDGPSATTAFTILIYSLFNDIKIKNYFGITGETHFGYFLTEIGGLQEKIINSIKSGIKEFIFPKENQTDFDKIMEKYKENPIIEGIKFHSIEHIYQVLDLILEKEL
jgi:ATP-dependent Lon protease